jgi:hypothetical protein
MPVRVRPRRKGEGGKLWKIVETNTGAVKAESDTRSSAEASARIRNQALREREQRRRR